MAAKTQITNKGLELLASSSKATGQHWWIGWYALAFVPDELQEEDGEKLDPSMTKLTENGDIIYNIFQGDMNGDGYQTTKASSKFKSVNYDSNIKKNYRYVLDEDGKNNLVTFVDGTKGLKGAYVYPGVEVNTSRDNNGIGYTKSQIPLPAPLLYTGVKAAGEGWSINGMNIFLGSGNDSIDKFYPVDENVTEMNVPRVSADFRNYEGYKNGLPKLDDGEESYDDALNGTLDGVDFDGWFPSVNTYTQNGETDMGEDYNQYCHQYWKILSISNFNKYCAPVNASGLLYDENTGCRNMAKATKYFPISDYSVTSTAKTADNEYATGIKLKVQLKLNGNAEDDAYFKDVEGDADNVASLIPSPTEEQQKLFNSQMVSFKFNRIGIYAVPMRQYGCSGDSAEMKAQYQIDTEAEPVLFAVCEWDSPVTLSDSGEGLSEFQSDIFVDLSAAVDDSSVIRESAVFYNLYEDDAIDWYKNQLVANAAMGEAIINMQIEMGYIRDQKNAKGCCPKSEEIKQNNKASTGLRNLVDAEDYNSNSVRNRLAAEEGKAIDAVYSDTILHFGGFGYPHVNRTNFPGIYARKTTVVHEQGEGQTPITENHYSAFFGESRYMKTPFEDAVFKDGDDNDIAYHDMATTSYTEDEDRAIRMGGLWVRRDLYYEVYSFVTSTNPLEDTFTYDYPDDADTNGFVNPIGTVVDTFGETLPGRGQDGTVIITKTSAGTTWKDKDATTSNQGLPPELTATAVPELYAEIDRSLSDYETQRVYEVPYYQYTENRDYSGYAVERTTSLRLPKVQLYNINQLSAVKQQLSSTKWRIPTLSDWTAIIAESTDEKMAKIMSSANWNQTGGEGGVFPLGGAMTTRSGKTLYYDMESPAIYLAIDGTTDQVVVMRENPETHKFGFEIISTPSAPNGSVNYISILCVADAVKVSDPITKYKLGYDSYALMEGSVSAGMHNFNASENSIITESAHYNSIFGGMNNTINNSSHNTVLNGFNNQLTGAVFATVCGNNNLLQLDSDNTAVCNTLMVARNSVARGCLTSLIATENSEIDSTKIGSVLGYSVRINGASVCWCSRISAHSSEFTREVKCSDVLAHSAYHIPQLYMTRATVSNVGVPNVKGLDEGTGIVNCSDFIGYNVQFFAKPTEDQSDISDARTLFCSRMAAQSSGLIKTKAILSDVYTQFDGSGLDSRLKNRTLESVSIYESSIKLCNSTIGSNYIDNPVDSGRISFCDISLCSSIMLLTTEGATGTTKDIAFGVMKLANSCIELSDCAYIYDVGDNHCLSNSNIRYATLVGKTITLTSSSFQNLHLYGSLTLSTSLANHLILSGLDGTNVGNGFAASNYISEFGSYIVANDHGYPMIWSLGGIGMFMNKMVLGDKGVADADKKAPSIGDVLTVVGTEDNIATVAWKSGGAAGGGRSDIIVFQDDGVMVPYQDGRKFVSFSGEAVSTATYKRYSLFQDGQFTVYGNDGNIPLFLVPSTVNSYGLRPNGTNHIVWNTWYKIKAYGIFEDDPEGTTAHVTDVVNGYPRTLGNGLNNHSTMVVITDALVEGLVYEVTINIRAIARLGGSDTGSTADGQAYGTMHAPDRFSKHFSLAFYDSAGNAQNAKRWADSSSNGVNYLVSPRFNRVPTDDTGTGYGPGTTATEQPPVLASAKVYFVKVDGSIYIMAY